MLTTGAVLLSSNHHHLLLFFSERVTKTATEATLILIGRHTITWAQITLLELHVDGIMHTTALRLTLSLGDLACCTLAGRSMVGRLGRLELGRQDWLLGAIGEDLHLEQLLDSKLIGMDETVVP